MHDVDFDVAFQLLIEMNISVCPWIDPQIQYLHLEVCFHRGALHLSGIAYRSVVAMAVYVCACVCVRVHKVLFHQWFVCIVRLMVIQIQWIVWRNVHQQQGHRSYFFPSLVLES